MEIVVALIMYLDGSMIEHTYKDKMSDCLRSKRIAEREVNPTSVRFACKRVNAKTQGRIISTLKTFFNFLVL